MQSVMKGTFYVTQDTFKKCRRGSRGVCMKRHTCWTTYVMSGLVKVKYWRAPARRRYRVPSGRKGPTVAFSLDEMSTCVVVALHDAMEARSRIS